MVGVWEAASEIRSRDRHGRLLRVFWVTVGDERDAFARDLRRSLSDLPVVCYVVRKGGFGDPNSVMNDVLSAMCECRNEIGAIEERACAVGWVDFVLVGRREWQVADSSSPLELPEWFPVGGGRTATVGMLDLTWSANVPLDDGSALDDVRRILYDVDIALVDALERARERDHTKLQPLWQRLELGNGGDRQIQEELCRVETALQDVGNPTKYRPSARGSTLVERLWGHTNRTSPDSLPRTAAELARALGVTADRAQDISFVSVLNRPTNRIEDVAARWGYGLLVTVRSACQLVTVAAHADRYPRFPGVLLKSNSLDIRRFLDAAVGVLRDSGAPGE